MKEKIHPEYHDITVTCACGAAYLLGSTKQSLRVDICAACHPLFTGKQKLMDTEGRVEKFRKRYSAVTVPRRAKVKPAAKVTSAPAAKSVTKAVPKASSKAATPAS